MKYLLIISTILVSYFSVNLLNNLEHDELFTIANVLEMNNYVIKEWGIYSRKPIGEAKNEEEFYYMANEITKNREEYKWTSIEDVNHHIKLVGIYEDKQDQFSHRILITAVKYDEKYKVEVANEVKGDLWNQNIHTILADIDFQFNQESTFYSIKGEANKDNLGEVELVKKQEN